EESRKAMKKILKDIQEGTFSTEWLLENKVNSPKFKALVKLEEQHPIEEVGKKIREMMPWISEKK
ncbi:MAG: ketol-acid reductoisomerase, partial [Candidatus Caldatribacteriota bacterium]|nr:ketol-acid reductoisomerase [Candidatus Caldatribacteriota bacterium]